MFDTLSVYETLSLVSYYISLMVLCFIFFFKLLGAIDQHNDELAPAVDEDIVAPNGDDATALTLPSQQVNGSLS